MKKTAGCLVGNQEYEERDDPAERTVEKVACDDYPLNTLVGQ